MSREAEMQAVVDETANSEPTPEKIAEFESAFNEEAERVFRIFSEMPGQLGLMLGAVMATALRVRDPKAYNDVLLGAQDWALGNAA